jgi:hypothetical protein
MDYLNRVLLNYSKKILFLIIYLFSFSTFLYAQASPELLLQKGDEYISKGNKENVDLGIGLIIESIKRNPEFAKAYTRLGVLYFDGKYISSDYTLSYTFLKEAAHKLNYLPAKIEFSKLLIKLQRFEEAARELLALKKINNPEVNYYLGILYMDGLGISKNINKAKKLFIASKEQGFSKSNDALNAINAMLKEKEEIKEQKRQTKERIAQKKLEERKRLSSNLDDKCSSLSGNTTAWMACMKNESAMFGINLNSYYAMRHECSLLAGNDDTGLSYLCSNPSSSGCIGLKASQDVINACYQCKGSNLWLRVYATGTILKCY